MGRAPIYFSEIFRSGPRTYLLEVKRSQRGKKYFTITEIDDPPEASQSVIVFDYCADKFWNLVKDAVQNEVPEIDPAEWTRVPPPKDGAKRTAQIKPLRPKTNRAAKAAKRAHRNQGKRWTESHDAELVAHTKSGKTPEEMAELLGRGLFSIKVRLAKLGLKLDDA